MPSEIAIIAALPREIAGLVRGSRPDAALLREGIHLHHVRGAVVVAAGMGAARVVLAVEAALAAAAVTTLISTGLAGACAPDLLPGSVAEATLVIDANTGERFETAAIGLRACVLVTTHAIAGVREKARLATSYAASLVDMEATAVARLAVARGLRFRAIKAVSDGHDFELATLSRFAGKHGSFRTGAFALHTALRPHHWARAAKLGGDSSRALNALHDGLRQVIAED